MWVVVSSRSNLLHEGYVVVVVALSRQRAARQRDVSTERAGLLPPRHELYHLPPLHLVPQQCAQLSAAGLEGAVVHLRAHEQQLPVHARVVGHQPGQIQERELVPQPLQISPEEFPGRHVVQVGHVDAHGVLSLCDDLHSPHLHGVYYLLLHARNASGRRESEAIVALSCASPRSCESL
jgi:hypothetical protein